MKKCFAVGGGALMLAAAFFFPCVHAQQKPLSTATLAQRVDRHYNTLRSLKANFIESYQGLGMTRTESGVLYLRKPGRMRWAYSQPKGKVFVLDGKFAWFYTTGDPQVQRVPAKELDDIRSPLRFLLGHTELEKEMSHLSSAPAADGEFTLSGQPKGQENRVTRISLTVTAEGAITGIEIQEPDGSVTRFVFSHQEPNAVIAEDTFRFTPPKGIPIAEAPPPV